MVLGENGGKPKVASLGVRCTLRKQKVWFDSRRLRLSRLGMKGEIFFQRPIPQKRVFSLFARD